MKVEELDYYLPPSLIAYNPLVRRDHSQLLILNKEDGKITHGIFKDIINYLNPEDVLVLNDTKVFPAKMKGKEILNNSKVEVLLLKELVPPNIWKALIKPKRRLKKGKIFEFNKKIFAEVVEIIDQVAILELKYEGEFFKILEEVGEMPLPPYIKRDERKKDRIDYQTVYAKNRGSIAAPTAGFHFTRRLLREIEEKGVKIVYITLHIGWGTFKPITNLNIEEHEMLPENYYISEEASRIINNCKGRVIAVGTTTTRALESAYSEEEGKVLSGEKIATLYIYPGYKFKVIDALITNFHLPKSTLLALVYAFGGAEKVKSAYQEAIERKYRFYSFGDAMFIY